MTRSHVAAAERYMADVLEGRIPACKWVKLACERQRRDLGRQSEDTWPYRFDPAAAERVCRFIELLPHIKGEWARRREKIRLEPWQSFIITTVFGWIEKETGLRRYRQVYEEVARKNAKSTKVAGVNLYMLGADGEEGAEVYSAATTRDQAKIVFGVGKAMAQKDAVFRDTFGIQVNAHNLSIEVSNSKFEALSSEGNTLDGLNPHSATIDELHAHKTREVYDVIETAMGARSQPLLWTITTAGTNRAGICYEVRTYATKILDGVVEDERFFAIVFTIDDGDDWTDPKVWAKANPNLGVSVDLEDMARLCRKAQEMPSAQPNFLTKRLNVWVNADSAWMDMRAWDRCGDSDWGIDQFTGEPCTVGIDLASKVDLAAKMKLFWRDDGLDECIRCGGTGRMGGKDDAECARCEGSGKSPKRHFWAFGRYYLPEERIEDTGNSQYAGWAREGRLALTPGNVIDFDHIEDDLVEDAGEHQIQAVGFDPFQATQFSTHMMAEGFPMVEVRATVQNFSEPMKELEALVLSGRFHHDGDPVLAWMVSNVVCHYDKKDNIYPNKERPENKIDGLVALLMALNLAMREEQAGSVYNRRGMLSV